jgi:hypothetical protein
MNDGYCWARRTFLFALLVTLSLAGWPEFGQAQPAGIQPQAAKLLRRMGDYLASRKRFIVKADTTLEVVLKSGQKLQFDTPAEAIVWRPNKLRSDRKGDITDQEFFYNGKTLTLYNPHENLYATTTAPPTLDAMLDFAREKLDVIAPGADFLYTNAAERMLGKASSGFVVGPGIVGGIKCTHLAFSATDVDWQIWIEDGPRPLLRKFVLTSTEVTGEPEFTAVVKRWDLAPKLTNRMFNFVPPKGAKKIEFLMLTAEADKAK